MPTEKITKEKYLEAVGRRKTAVARVRLFTKEKGIIVNGKNFGDYFKNEREKKAVLAPFELMKVEDKLGAIVKVHGGGPSAQAEAVRHGISRALILFNEEFKKRLRRVGLMTRNPRMVERKKYGRHKARRGHQWRKR